MRQALDANNGLSAAEIRDCAIDHLDAINHALATSQAERVGAIAAPQNTPYRDIVGLPVAVDHLEVEHFDVAAAGVQANGGEPTVTPSHAQDVMIDTEGNGLTAEVDPIAVSALGKGITRHHPGKYQRRSQ